MISSFRVRDEFLVGIFLLFGFILFVISLYIMGSERAIFSDKVTYTSNYKNVLGLREGAPVRLGGITVGRVDKVRFREFSEEHKNLDEKEKRIEVIFEINKDYQNLIKTDSKTQIATQGLLGDRFLELTNGFALETLQLGKEVPSLEDNGIESLMSKSDTIFISLNKTFNSFQALLDELRQDNLDNFNNSIKNLNIILSDIKDITNPVAKAFKETSDNKEEGSLTYSLLFDKKINQEFKQTVSNIKEITASLNENKSLISALIKNKEGEIVFDDIQKSIKNIKNFSEFLDNHSKGKKNQSIVSLILELNKASENLTKITKAIKEGEGTIGALITDPSLYNSMINLSDKANSNILVKKAVEYSLSK